MSRLENKNENISNLNFAKKYKKPIIHESIEKTNKNNFNNLDFNDLDTEAFNE